MKLIATMPVRNEGWCLGLSLRVALLWCDAVVILLHECTDDSGDIVEQIIRENDRGRIHVLRASGEWTEMQHRQAMLLEARERGATHIAIVDADEVISGNILHEAAPDVVPGWKLLRDGVRALDQEWRGGGQFIMQLPLYNLRGGLERYHANGIWGGKSTCLAFRDDPRLSWSGDRFHHRHPTGVPLQPYAPIKWGDGGIMHLWGVSERRLHAKHRMYRIQERLRWPNKQSAEIERMYGWAEHGDTRNPMFGTPDTWTYAEVPASWWAPYEQWLKHVHLGTIPWQEQWCDEMIQKHGRETFVGLNID